MSVFRPRIVICPHCNRRGAATVAWSINATRREDLRAAILEDRFQRTRCIACRQPFAIDGPLFYLDFVRHQWLGVYPRAWESSWRAIESELQRGFDNAAVKFAPKLIRDQADSFLVRAVFGLDALRDKVACATARLDDVTLELLKLDLMRSAPELRFHPGERLSLLSADRDELRFTVAQGNVRAVRVYGVPRDRYRAIARGRAWKRARHLVSGGPYVDVGRVLLDGDAPSDFVTR